MTTDCAEQPACKNDEDENGDDAGQPGARIDAPLMRPEQQFQTEQHRQRLCDRKDGHPRRDAVVDENEQRQAGEAETCDQRGVAP
jgi:hypothetical protein